jgi:hypothetical protein
MRIISWQPFLNLLRMGTGKRWKGAWRGLWDFLVSHIDQRNQSLSR